MPTSKSQSKLDRKQDKHLKRIKTHAIINLLILILQQLQYYFFLKGKLRLIYIKIDSFNLYVEQAMLKNSKILPSKNLFVILLAV